jgi:hypothetical protein
MATANNALAKFDKKKVETKLAILKKMVQEIEVTDQHGYETVCKLVLDGRDEIKAIGFVYDPIIASARAHLDDVRNQKAQWVNQIQPLVDAAAKKGSDWKADERKKAQDEQDRINREAQEKADAEAKEVFANASKEANDYQKRKLQEVERLLKAKQITKAEAVRRRDAIMAEVEERKQEAATEAQAVREAPKAAPVTVQPNVPKVAGIRGRVNWKWKMVDIEKVQRHNIYPNDISDVANFPRITAEVRRIKDKAKAEAAIPGIEVWSEDAI